MRPFTVVIALQGALDIAAARRLHDYGGLDDADVARALEQVHMQRFGHIDWPAHLCRLSHVVAVIEQGDEVRIVASDSSDDEAAALARLFAHWPEGDGEIVAWRTHEPALIAARAFMHDLSLPAGFSAASRIGLAEWLSPAGVGVPQSDHDTETELAHLLDRSETQDHRSSNDSLAAHTRRAAIGRYCWWLRWQYVAGTITRADRLRRETALAAGLRAAVSA